MVSRDEAQTSGPSAVRVGVELFFWGAVLVLLGHVLSYRLADALRMAPHARLGRMLVLIGACFLHGGFSRTRLARWSAVFVSVCAAQFAFMVVAWAGLHVGLFGRSIIRPDIVARVRSLEIALDLAVLVALVQLLGAGGVISRAGHRLGLVFYGSLAGAALVAPAALGRDFWLWLHAYLGSDSAEPAIVVGQVTVIVLTLIVVIRAHRLLAVEGLRELAAAGPDGRGAEE
jgi:hypothetical protein